MAFEMGSPPTLEVMDAGASPEKSMDKLGEGENWISAIELPDDTGGWQDSIKLPDDKGEWQDRIELPDDTGDTRLGLNTDVSPENDVEKAKEPIKNKLDGLVREKEVLDELSKNYSPEDGYQIVSEAYLRDKDGNIVKDAESGTARRIDFVIVKNNKVIDSIEVTSKSADKTEQSAKESRIREAGGNYVCDNEGNLVEIPSTVQTRIERRD